MAELESEMGRRAEESYQGGFRDGEAAGRALVEAEVKAVLERLAATVAEVAQSRAQTLRLAEADVVKLSIEIARRILHRELNIDPRAMEGLVKSALEKLQSETILRARVHPDHAGILRECIERLGRGSQIEIVADSTQELGGAVFETARGGLDASLDTQLREIELGLADRLRNI
jgi:flagellar assembly protein FliH